MHRRSRNRDAYCVPPRLIKKLRIRMRGSTYKLRSSMDNALPSFYHYARDVLRSFHIPFVRSYHFYYHRYNSNIS